MTTAQHLTHREKQVRDLVVLGYTSKEVGLSLGISSRTVEDFKSTIYQKYSVRNAVELTRAVFLLDPVGCAA